MISKDKLIADPAVALEGDSVAAFLRDGAGNALTSTSGALDVNIDNASIAVTASNLDIRDLAFATDKVDVSGSSVSISGTVAVTQSTSPWVVSASDLDIRDLAFATDKVDVSGSEVSLDSATLAALENITVSATDLDIRNLVFATDKVDVSGSSVELGATTLAALETITVLQGTSPWVVSASDLDIRDLSHVSDSIKIGDGTDFLAVNNDGSINVQGTFTIDGQYAEDSAHVSGDVGLYNLAVRADAPAVGSSASGDYASQTVDAYNRSWVNSGSNVSLTHGANQIVDTAELIVASAAGRRKILIQNLQNKEIWLGGSGVTAANGIRVASGGNVELEIGPALDLYAISAASVSGDVRFLQLA
jgi:hypothetical protein